MADDIKSALEIAMEKAEKLGQLTEEERLELKYVPEGEKLAATFLKEDSNIAAELAKYDKAVAPFVVDGATAILIRNITLPRNDLAKKTNKRAMEALKAIKTNKPAIENIFSKVRRLFNHYVEEGEQQRKAAYEELKAEMLQRVQQAAQQQGVMNTGRVNVERLPQFQEEWRRLLIRLDAQYIKLLDEYKQELVATP